MTRFIFTCGDINGIGPEIALKVFGRPIKSGKDQIIFACPQNVFDDACKLTGIYPEFEVIKSAEQITAFNSRLVLYNIGNHRISPGKATLSSGRASYKSLEAAMELIDRGLADALVTLPISKTSIAKAGFKYPGHTEYLAAKSGSSDYTMMFLSSELKCSLTTIHEPIKKVPKLITRDAVKKQIGIVRESLQKDFNIADPRIAVLGLNPHAGEGGKIGREDVDEIIPAINESGKNVYGPFVPDAFFGNKLYKDYDCVIGMYHDQVLIPFKMLDFTGGVNFTAGLKFVRTSPDHGTAFDIAWQNKANPESTLKAFRYAQQIINSRKQFE